MNHQATSWRGLIDTEVWREHDAVILSDGGPTGRKHYEVYVAGSQIAGRSSLAEAKAAAEAAAGHILQWRTMRHEPMEVEHYTLGPTTEFGTPTSYWVADE